MSVQQFIGVTKRYKAAETLGADPSPSPLPCLWTTNDPDDLVLAPVSPDANGAAFECDVTVKASAVPHSVSLYAKVPNGPQGNVVIDMILPVDGVTILQE
jgi:hypothetical protein